MPWSSVYQARYTKPIVRQMMAVVQRDQRAALDFVGGAGVLPSIVAYQLAPLSTPQFPALMIAPERTAFDHEAVGSRHSANRFYLAIAVTNHNRQVTAELIQDYVLAMDAVFNTVPLSDFSLALPLALPHLGPGFNTSGLTGGILKELFVASHNYDEIRIKRDQFSGIGILELLVDLEEA